MSCTVVLIGHTDEEASAWDGVIDPLTLAGHSVISAAVESRGLTEDTAAVGELISSIEGATLLVGHSYGGSVISGVDPDCGDIAGLVYVAGFAPEPGESCLSLSAMFPGGTLPRKTGNYAVLAEGFGGSPLWRDRPSWFLFGDSDRLIPVATQRYMAKRAGARRTIEIPGASDTVAVSHPASTYGLILEAASLPSWAEPVIP